MWKNRFLLFFRRHQWYFKAGIMALLPFLCCFVTCGMDGFAIGDVYLPSCEWNDELFYYKQVEGILEYGYPQGYFGFNESHALRLSFAAWSPVLLLPWVLWGLIFGWSLISPVYCNIALMMLAVFCFVLLCRPSGRQLGILTILFCLFSPLTRYLLSGMPETVCFCFLILFYGFAVSYLHRGERGWKIAGMLIFSSLLTLMRPYMILFLLLPVFLWIRKDRSIKSAAGSLAVLTATAGIYAAVRHYLGAAYFTPLFQTEWITKFFKDGFFAGCKYMLGTLWYQGGEFVEKILEGFRTGRAEGAYFACFLCILFIGIWEAFVSFRKKRKQDFLLYGHMASAFAAMLAALLLMYKLTEGSRHLLAFIVAGIFLVSMMETRFYKKAMLLGALFAFFFMLKGQEIPEYQVPYKNEERLEETAYWEQALGEGMELALENAPGFENVVIWVFSDVIPGTGQEIQTGWQALYAAPPGFGISCCYREYVTEHFSELNSRYIATVPGGEIARMCEKAGFREIGRRAETVVYQRY